MDKLLAGFRIVSVRCKGGSSKAEKAQLEQMYKQEQLQKELEAIDLEFYELRQNNKAMYDEDFRPLEEGLLERAALDATESTSAEGRTAHYDATDDGEEAALARRNERYGITNVAGTEDDVDDEMIRAIALTAAGNISRTVSLESQSKMAAASVGIGAEVNTDIGRGYHNALTGMDRGIAHTQAAFANYGMAQQHENNASIAKMNGYNALLQGASGVAQLGVSNFQTAKTEATFNNDGSEANWKSAFSGKSY